MATHSSILEGIFDSLISGHNGTSAIGALFNALEGKLYTLPANYNKILLAHIVCMTFAFLFAYPLLSLLVWCRFVEKRAIAKRQQTGYESRKNSWFGSTGWQEKGAIFDVNPRFSIFDDDSMASKSDERSRSRDRLDSTASTDSLRSMKPGICGIEDGILPRQASQIRSNSPDSQTLAPAASQFDKPIMFTFLSAALASVAGIALGSPLIAQNNALNRQISASLLHIVFGGVFFMLILMSFATGHLLKGRLTDNTHVQGGMNKGNRMSSMISLRSALKAIRSDRDSTDDSERDSLLIKNSVGGYISRSFVTICVLGGVVAGILGIDLSQHLDRNLIVSWRPSHFVLFLVYGLVTAVTLLMLGPLILGLVWDKTTGSNSFSKCWSRTKTLGKSRGSRRPSDADVEKSRLQRMLEQSEFRKQVLRGDVFAQTNPAVLTRASSAPYMTTAPVAGYTMAQPYSIRGTAPFNGYDVPPPYNMVVTNPVVNPLSINPLISIPQAIAIASSISRRGTMTAQGLPIPQTRRSSNDEIPINKNFCLPANISKESLHK